MQELPLLQGICSPVLTETVCAGTVVKQLQGMCIAYLF